MTKVVMRPAAYQLMVAHALTTAQEEIMGTPVGYIQARPGGQREVERRWPESRERRREGEERKRHGVRRERRERQRDKEIEKRRGEREL